jgi:hypothetical protein
VTAHGLPTGPRRGSALALLVVLVVLAGPAVGAATPPPLEEQLSGDWYYTEMVIFERPAVLDHLSQEVLARPPGRLRRDLRSFPDPRSPASAGFALYNSTLPYLTFPYLDQSRLPDFTIPADAATDEAMDPADSPPGVAPPSLQPRLAEDPLLQFLDVLADYEATLNDDSYRWLPESSFTLGKEATALSRRGGFRVLMHGRWLQPVPARGAPEPVYIQVGPRQGDVHALEGTLEVVLGRYLHFRADLYFHTPLLGRAPVDFPRPPSESGTTSPPGVTEAALEPAGVVLLRESRRLRSGELHYLDHPKLGVLVRVEPVVPPPDVQQAYDALGQTPKESGQ